MRKLLLLPAALALLLSSRDSATVAVLPPAGGLGLASASPVVNFTEDSVPFELPAGLAGNFGDRDLGEATDPVVSGLMAAGADLELPAPPPPPEPPAPPPPPAAPAPAPAPATPHTHPAPAAGSPAPAGGVQAVLACIRQHESNGNYQATNGIYRGAYQFDYTTWESVGGSGDPAAASPAEQDQRAAQLYAQRGIQPWPLARC